MEAAAKYLRAKRQIERFIDSVQHLQAAGKIPVLDAEFWTLLEEHMAIMQLFLRVNLLIKVEDRPTLAPLLVCTAMLKCLFAPISDLVLSRMACRARSAEDACSDDVIWTKICAASQVDKECEGHLA